MNTLLNGMAEMSKVYRVAIYVRLSKEDENSVESESIQNQKDYVSRYVIEKGWHIEDIYCDDGYTGTNFDRPGFKKMIEDINAGKINMVVTKDFSRLGRDYIETGNYIEKYFPSKGVRYIAISDNIDTNTYNAMTPFLSIINDMYAGDISRKVRAVMNTKRSSGKFIGAFAPYGYKKCSEDKNKLIIDEEAAAIVRRIYDMYKEGSGIAAVAKSLNDENIPCPSTYKESIYKNYNNPKARLKLWTHETVKKILDDPTYIGCLTQNKYRKVNHKIKKLVTLAKNQWVTVEDTHEAIIDKETFEIVQNLMVGKSNTHFSSKKVGHLLTGLIFCGDCGERMTFTNPHSKGKYYCVCSKYKRFGDSHCSRHSIPEDTLLEYIIEDIKRIAQYAVDKEKLLKAVQNKGNKQEDNPVEKQIEKASARINEIKNIIKSLYEDKCKGILCESDFLELSKEYNAEREKLTLKLSELRDRKDQSNRINNENEFLINYIKQFTSFDNIDRTVLVRLINKVYIYEDRKIHIHYNFSSPERA